MVLYDLLKLSDLFRFQFVRVIWRTFFFSFLPLMTIRSSDSGLSNVCLIAVVDIPDCKRLYSCYKSERSFVALEDAFRY